jgi:hypothetical protein
MRGASSSQGRKTMTERNFHCERLAERLRELRQLHQDDAAFFVEASKVLLAIARNDRKRREAESLLKEMKIARRVGLFER